jgi:hypothetical protein
MSTKGTPKSCSCGACRRGKANAKKKGGEICSAERSLRHHSKSVLTEFKKASREYLNLLGETDEEEISLPAPYSSYTD